MYLKVMAMSLSTSPLLPPSSLSPSLDRQMQVTPGQWPVWLAECRSFHTITSPTTKVDLHAWSVVSPSLCCWCATGEQARIFRAGGWVEFNRVNGELVLPLRKARVLMVCL